MIILLSSLHCIISCCTLCRSWPRTPCTPWAPGRGRPPRSPPNQGRSLQILQALPVHTLIDSCWYSWYHHPPPCYAASWLSLLQAQSLYISRGAHYTGSDCICKNENIQVQHGEDIEASTQWSDTDHVRVGGGEGLCISCTQDWQRSVWGHYGSLWDTLGQGDYALGSLCEVILSKANCSQALRPRNNFLFPGLKQGPGTICLA